MYTVRTEAHFAAAHFLSNYGGKCEKLHGHNYRVRASAKGEELGTGGMLVDFAILKNALARALERLDHSLLNDIPEFANDPSAERIACLVFGELRSLLPGVPVCAVEVYETETTMARYEP
jgi:6-pyruvoyltetrahydropterin/6-carboxytetrahydropterin synthase